MKCLLAIIMLGLLIWAISIFVQDSINCSERGGELVRGVFWFKCIVVK